MKELWVPLSAAIAQQKKVDTIANNVANANTTGYKKDRLVFKEYLTAHHKMPDNIDLPSKEWRPEDFYHHNGAQNAFVKVDGTYTSHEQGQLFPTNNPFDVGIQGKGMIEVFTETGIRYTRNGSLTVSNEGLLVTDKGHPVLSKIPQAVLDQGAENSALIPRPQERFINIGNAKTIKITRDGKVFNGEQQLSEVSLVEFRDLAALKKQGAGLYINNDNQNLILDDVKSQLHQGMIERSNVNAVSEMSELIKAHRHFETIQNAIKTYDTIAGQAISELSRF